VLLLTDAAFMAYDNFTFRQSMVRDLSTTVSIIADTSTAVLAFKNDTAAQQILAALMHELSPEGVLEEIFATEIMTATWRLRRCHRVEADPAEQESVDRARAQSHNILRRSIAELRKLQTERTIRTQLDDPEMPRLADTKQVFNTLNIHDKQCLAARKANGLDTLEGLIAKADKNLGMRVMDKANCAAPATTSDTKAERSGLIPTESVAQTQDPWSDSSFCKSDQTPRNAPCPCGSGTKYKRCCGTNAPAVLNKAA